MQNKLGILNSIPAGMIDRIYRDYPKGWFGRILAAIKIRVIYAFMFLPLSVLDLGVNALKSIVNFIGVMVRSDNIQDKRLNSFKNNASLFSKNLYALLACIFGFFNPKLVTFYFTPELPHDSGVSAGGDYYHAKNAVLKKASSIENVQQIIRQAATEGKKVIPIGAGRSQGKQFIPSGEEDTIVIDLSELNSVEICSKDKVAIVGGGTIWSKIQKEANEHMLGLKVMQASNVFSVGGSIGTNIHGWDHQTGMLSNTILEMTIVNANGEVEVLTAKNDLFHHITGGLGLFGIVVSAKIQLTDNIMLQEIGVDIPPEAYQGYFQQEVLPNEQIKMHLYRLSLDPKQLLQSGIAVNYVQQHNASPIKTENLKMEAARGTRFDRVMINLARRFSFIRNLYWHQERQRLLANKGPETSLNEIMQPAINAMFNPAVSESEWLQEYFLPGEGLSQFLKDLSQLLMKNQVVLLNASVRFVKENSLSPLSYAQTKDRFAVVLCFNQSLNQSELIKAQKWLRQSQHLAIECGGAYYLPYQAVSSAEDFAQSYPRAKEALAKKQEVDPDNRFESGFYQQYLAVKSSQKNHFKVIMSTEENQREFAGFLKNVLHRIDPDKLFDLLKDIMQYKDSHADIYAELCLRLSEISPNALKDLKRILNSLSSIKHDLAVQAKSLLPHELKSINGLVEIGYPGRFVNGFKQHFNISGEVVAVYEGQTLSDYVQTGFPRPYDRFEQLNYANPDLKKLADNSADLITCYIGLHHFEEDKLHPFLDELRRVLRPNGRFLLVDHDIVDDTSMSMAHMAHTIFNAVTGVTLEEELNETRHFHSMGDWLRVLREHELHNSSMINSCYIRPGDPSRNMMACFVNSKELSLEKISKSLPYHAQAQEIIEQVPGFNLSHHGLFGAAGQARNGVVNHENEVVDEYYAQTKVTCP